MDHELIFNKNYDFLISISDETLYNSKQLEKILDFYTDKLEKIIGTDNPEAENYHEYKHYIEYLLNIRNVSPVVLNIFINKLAHKLELQEELANFAENILERSNITKGNKLAIFGGSAEVALDYLAQHSEHSLNFLRNQLSADSAMDLAIDISGKNTLKTFLDLNGFHEESRVAIEFKDLGPYKIKEFIANKLSEIHEHLWQMPLEVRGLVIDLIAFPTNKDYKNNFAQRRTQILDDLFPNVELSGEDGAYAKTIAREFIEAFLNHSEIEDQRYILSHLYAAGEPGDIVSLSVGKAIKEILSPLGPAGDKLAQAIANHYATPEPIRCELNDSKVKTSKATRAQMVRNAKSAMPDEFANGEITRIGESLGSGSTVDVMRMERANGEDMASSIIKSDIDEITNQAMYRFRQLKLAAADVVKKRPEFAVVQDMIEQAELSFYTEIDTKLAEQQAHIAEDIYDGAQVKVRKYNVHFSAAEWIGKTERSKSAKVIDGLHFMDLPEKTEQEIEIKKTIAKAILTIELRSILSGKEFDHDRHDGQQRITIIGNDIHVGNFDFGGVLIGEPSPEQKSALSEAVYKTIKSRPSAEQFSATLNQNIREIVKENQDNPETKHYLSAVARGLLALGNYTRVLSKEEMGEVISAVIKDDKELDILQNIKKSHGMEYNMAKVLNAGGKRSEITFTKPPKENQHHRFRVSETNSTAAL